MFTFFFHITYIEPTFFLCLGRVLYSFVSLNQLPTFYPWTLKVVKYLWGFFFFNMKIFFYQLHCLWDIFTICHCHFPHRCWEIHLYLFPLAAYLESWKMTVDIPLIIYSLSPPMLELNFTFSVITFCFIMTFSSLLTSPSFDQTIF